MARLPYAFFIFLVLLTCGCQPRPQNSAQSVADQSPTLAATFRSCDTTQFSECDFSNGRESGLNCILEIVGGGVGCFDYDLDGCSDLFFPRGGQIDVQNKKVTGKACKLMRGDGKLGFSDISSSAFIESERLYTHGVSSVDFDHDGFCDVLVYGYGGVILFHNLGDGTFLDITALAGLSEAPWTTAAAWIDIDGDKNLDLCLGSYVNWNFDSQQTCKAKNGEPDVCSPNAFDGMQNSVFLNCGDVSYSREDSLMSSPLPTKTLGMLTAEFGSGEGVGLYVANDLIANLLFTRRGGRFVEHGLASGVALDDAGVANGSMGVALFDFNLDRRFDLFVTNFEHELMALYVNVDGDYFTHRSRQVGLNRSDMRVVAFGVVAGDFDGDADEDIAFTSGHVHYHPDAGKMEQQPVYLQNEAGLKLTKLVPQCKFFKEDCVGRGLACADLDNDGDLDLVGTSLFGPPTMTENMGMASSHWLTVSLVGVNCPRTPVGATAVLTVGNTSMARQLYAGGSYLSQNQQRLHFAWPVASASESQKDLATLAIRWPDGTESKPMQVEIDRHHTIVQRGGE